MSECPISFKPSYYYRYVDDTFLLFKSQSHIKQFLDFINSKHPNIKFTCEYEKENKLSFLDVSISRKDNNFVTSVFRKPTYTGLTTKFDSFIPLKFKSNLVSILIYRAFKISSNYFVMVKEFEFIKEILRKNGFPLYYIQKIINKTLNNLLVKREKFSTVPKDIIMLKLPYLGSMSHSISKKLNKIISSNYNTVDIRLIFTSGNTISRYFRFKDRIPVSLCSSIVYQYTCGSCSASYIGKTSRNLSIRVDEHKGLSFRTKQPLNRPIQSSIREHSDSLDHPILDKDFSVLDSSNLGRDLIILESLWIWKKRPSLNDYSSSTNIELLG